MKILPYPDRWHFDAAHGWLMLENPREAQAEFSKISPRFHALPEVRELRCRFLIEEKRWAEALALTQVQFERAPERPQTWLYRAFCLHELGRTQDAFKLLRVAARKFPSHRIIAFNLACYCCHLKKFGAALRWTRRAMKLFGGASVSSACI